MKSSLTALQVLVVAAGTLLTAACAASGPAPAEAPEAAPAAEPARYDLIPWPRQVEARPGAFPLAAATRVTLSDPASAELRSIADFLVGYIQATAGVRVGMEAGAVPQGTAGTIALHLNSAAGIAPEGYRLAVTPEGVTLTASAPAGLFYGVQTLRQLLPAASAAAAPAIPAVQIEDAPRFRYRGMHLDVARHFFPVEFVKRYIDLLAMHKMNTFHWHLTEDQGWRIEIKRYPKLTEVGACRKETRIGHERDKAGFDRVPYCGFYTQEQIREIVDYARERHVTIIPEIELPGHSRAALAAYPELGCTPGPFEVATSWGIFEDIYCPKEETFTFLEGVLTEVMQLFPGEYIHIGGDEAPKTRWRESEVAQAVMRREGLRDEHELQSYFIRRVERFLNAHGRRLIGWDEIIEGGLSPTATVMYWRDRQNAGVGVHGGEDPARVAVRNGNDLIMTPNQTLYFDHYQADPAGEPLAIGGLTTLREVYEYEPVPDDFSPQEARHVLGAQGNVWTEYMKTPEHVEYMVFPRLIALAEVVWSPREARDWSSFVERLPAHLRRLDALGVRYRAPRAAELSPAPAARP
jgi:hexosaminidase